MPLTVSLYREDEVIAALKWSLINGQTVEAMFWAQECSDSNMLSEALQAAVWAWVFGCGPSALGWFSRFCDCVKMGNQLEDAELMGLIGSLTLHRYRRPDSSALVLLGLGLREDSAGPIPPDVPRPLHLLGELNSENASERAIVRAILQGKIALAWYLLRPLWVLNGWSIIKRVCGEEKAVSRYLLEHAREYMGGVWKTEYTWLLRAVAVASLVPHKKIVAEESLAPLYMNHWNEWKSLSMRRRRCFPIPVTALYWHTSRGSLRVSDSTEEELMSGLEASMVGSRVWCTVLEELHDDRQLFYERYFPNDIPDEWSCKDRELSHGRGVIPVGNPDHRILFRVCIDRWFQRIPNCIWMGTERALGEFKRRWENGPPPTFELGIHEAYSERDWNFSMAWNCEPVARKFVMG
jgi:hypothetical protein